MIDDKLEMYLAEIEFALAHVKTKMLLLRDFLSKQANGTKECGPEQFRLARLIAAAPDLLEALHAVQAICSQTPSLSGTPAYQMATAAIAKAEGKQA